MSFSNYDEPCFAYDFFYLFKDIALYYMVIAAIIEKTKAIVCAWFFVSFLSFFCFSFLFSSVTVGVPLPRGLLTITNRNGQRSSNKQDLGSASFFRSG